MSTYAVTPINDTESHEDYSSTCKCYPTVKFENGNMIIIHNSFDGREGVEMAKEILNKTNGKRNNDKTRHQTNHQARAYAFE